MAGQWGDWFEREELIGQISDIRVQNLQVEREVVQTRTFTRWMNLHLEKCNPPVEVQDLFRDVQDGRVLMALLEELSGCKLLHGFKKSSHRIFRLNNIAKVLSFLEERNVKLVSIDAADVADGNASIILGLIWNIILFFQIKELTGNIRSQFPSSSSLSSIPTSSDSDTSCCSSPSDERQPASTAVREHSKAIKKLLQWVQKRTRKYGVAVQDFGKSWTSGLAFLAVIKAIDPSLVDMRKALLRSPRENMEDAFRIAHYSLGIPRLLEPEDVTINAPDEQCIMTYVSQFLEHFPGVEEVQEPSLLIERSVSMGRLNFRDGDSFIRNAADRRRVRERSYMFQKDCAQPPPKVLLSSVSEDRTAVSPRPRPAAARSWSSEDFLADSPHVEDVSSVSRTEVSEVLSNSTSQLSQTHSPTSSAQPESATGDSAINSPDSWVEGEFGTMSEKTGESTSDSAWLVYRATPVEVTVSDEGFVPSAEDKTPEEQSITESYTDEGIYSLSSLESTQEQNQGHPDKKQVQEVKRVNDDNCNQHKAAEEGPDQSRDVDCEPVQTSGLQTDEVPTEQRCEILSNSGEDRVLKADEPTRSQRCTNEPESLEEGADGAAARLKDPVTFAEGGQHAAEQNDHIHGLLKANSSENDDGQNDRQQTEREVLNATEEEPVETPENTSEALLRSCTDHQRSISTDASNASSHEGASNTSLEQGAESNIPLISFSSDAEEQLKEETSDPEPDVAGRNGTESQELTCDSKTGVGNPKTTQCGHNDDVENGQLEDIVEHDDSNCPGDVGVPCSAQNMEASEDQLDCESALGADGTSTAQTSIETEQQGPGDTFALKQRDDTRQSSSHSVHPGSDGNTATLVYEPLSVSRSMDLFYADRGSPTEDIVGEPVEPMDLFYPDKEEPVSSEPSDTDVQSWPSVLSVSALEPAPAAAAPADERPLNLLGEDLWNDAFVQDHDKVMTKQESECLFGDGTGGLGPDLPADGCDERSRGFARGSSESVSPDESPLAPVLRHRKAARFTQATDSPTTVAAGTREAGGGDSELWWDDWELYLLLLLWLLLYSVWLLPQMDLKTLPSLLLNLKP